jgi:hypothetical protein
MELAGAQMHVAAPISKTAASEPPAWMRRKIG